MGTHVPVQASDGTFQAYLARPRNDAAPAVVVLQELFGVNADLRATCDELAADGYLAISPDLFWRLEPGLDMSDRTEAEWKKGLDLYGRYDFDRGVEDIATTIAAARALPGATGAVAVLGYCLGGLMSYLATVRHGAQASVVYYGGGMEKHLDAAGRIANPMLVHLGEADEYIPRAAREAIIGALHDVPGAQVFTYPGCRHAFARHGGAHYDATAAALANARTGAASSSDVTRGSRPRHHVRRSRRMSGFIPKFFAVVALIAALVPRAALADDAVAVRYRTERIDGANVFYRDAGPRGAPAIVLLHGFPTSSHMFRDLIPRLADRYRVIAPDYPGFGFSDQPDRSAFAYTFDHYASIVDQLLQRLGIARYALYVMDYGAPVGFRLAVAHPERVTGFVVQNGNAYDEGFGEQFWAPIMKYWRSHSVEDREANRWLTTRKATHWQYTNGVKDVGLVSPDAEAIDQALLDRPGNADVQLDLFYDYRTNPPLYPRWHEYFRTHQPPMLIVWGQNDEIFPATGAPPYQQDLKNVEMHLFDTGHFALETHGGEIARLIRDFLGRVGR